MKIKNPSSENPITRKGGGKSSASRVNAPTGETSASVPSAGGPPKSPMSGHGGGKKRG